LGVTVARTAGFCWGVRRAVDLVITELKKGGKPFRVFGPLVHNPSVMEALAERGVSVCDDPDNLSGGTLFLRTHGVTDDERRWLDGLPVTVRDLTCPRVGRALSLARRKREEGYRVIILGDPGHQEVKAIRSCAGEDSIVISGPGDVEGLPEMEKPFLISQTTQSTSLYRDTLEALERRFPGALSENTICESTDRRQAELRKLCPRADCVVVVGGRQSANTARLVRTASEEGLPVFHVEDHTELEEESLRDFRNILVTAGASTPNWSIRKVRERLLEIQGVRGSGRIRNLVRNLVFANAHIPFVAMIVGAAGSRLIGDTGWRVSILSSSLLLFSFHTLTAVFEATVSRFASQKRQDFVLRNRWVLAVCSLAAMTAAMVLSISQGIEWMAVTALSTLFFLVYSLPLLTRRSLLPEGLRRVPGSRDILFALGWAVLLAFLPALTLTEAPGIEVILYWPASLFLLFLARSIFVDLVDLQGDALMGLDTIPLSLGAGRSRMLLLVSALLSSLVQIGAVAVGELPPEALGFLAAPLWLCLGQQMLQRSALPTELAVRVVADGSLLLAGLCPFVLSMVT
jgi:(E)-4-hydroxy-3-methyl-but-2-enyl pyrophosphate reductase